MTTIVAMNTPALVIDHLHVARGECVVLTGVDLRVDTGERAWIAGPNGAGKTTLLDAISGAVDTTRGTIRLHGRRIERASIAARAREGLGRSFQAARLFPSATVREQLTLARQPHSLGLRTLPVDAQIDPWAARLGLTEWLDTPADRLGQAQRKLIDLAIALVAKPRVLLLDEPSAGLTRDEARRMYDWLHHATTSVTCILVEHDATLAQRFTRRTYALNEGRLTLMRTQNA
ncbi:MAG TPA: ATP-binding cassette domain-containing protein [Burkholderiaceae bacterium]|nr:ATP-binding cassette domain-containing protein [Burkholderiaceae bacterium]